jgi:D-alanyl-D-alanine carboxypeptidase/D-alanyl-D-alanine-endopeptidase (penicillin-binding protein 4)
LNSRKPIYAILFVGLLVIVALTFTPYALISRARMAVTATLRPAPQSPALREIAQAQPTPPPFDVRSWYEERGADPSRHGVLIESLDAKQTFASHNAEQTFNPASLVKLTTTLSVLRRLGKDFRFETRIFIEGTTDKAGVLKGKLIVAGGDPTFGDVAAALIARKLEERGVKRVPDELVVTGDFSYNYSEKPDDSASRLAKALKLTPKTLSIGEAPAGTPAFVLQSYPLREILLYMNAHSSNFVAERLGALVGGPEGVREFLVRELHIPPDEVMLSTASGLEVNRLTPRGLVAVIRALDEEASRQGLKLEDIMAVASDDRGTLRRRLVGTPLESAVIGKTGTLVHDDGGMSSLGGIVYTQHAGKVCFVMLNQGSSIAESKQMTDQLLVQVILSKDLPAPIPMPEKPRNMLERSELIIVEE